MHVSKFSKSKVALLVSMLFAYPVYAQSTDINSDESNNSEQVASEGGSLETVRVIGTAEEEMRQSLGYSVITAEDIEKRPPVNDISDIVRTMPGVNLTGSSASGQRGNNRQIEIRGMGPENTLILVDGKPVTSRNSVRYGWRGERDTRGDSNWVPASEIERIEVLRGPSAARYGSGAAGGVVNIITKRNTDKIGGSITVYANKPEHSNEGATTRSTFDLSGPIGERLSFRMYGNINKTDADDSDINSDATISGNSAGREGVRNRDIAGRLTWNLADGHTIDFDGSFSRQGNIYAGDSQNNIALDDNRSYLLGRETNRMYRESYSITHNGIYDFGTSMSYLQYTNTRNTRLVEALAGGPEGSITSPNDFNTSKLSDYVAHTEVNVPLNTFGVRHVLTTGLEWSMSKMDDPSSMTQSLNFGNITHIPYTTGERSGHMSSNMKSFFVEDNIGVTDRFILTPGLRFDHHSISGSNWSPSLNGSFDLTDRITFKAGIARAYKAPNLFQTNANYLLASRGNGCYDSGSCYLLGNADLKPEISINKEIGFEYKTPDNFRFGVTYFRNDYRNKIQAGTDIIAKTSTGYNIYEWTNVSKAVIEGLEGSVNIPVLSNLNWSTNFTYMINSENKETGEVLSLTPEYTINSTLDWRPTAQWSLQGTLTYYGRIKPMRYSYKGELLTGQAATTRGSYALVGLSSTYQVHDQLHFTVGISNLFDKRLYRRGNSTSAGSETFNEPGRAFYISATHKF
ncbi:Ferric enterobactin receptor [Saezia sanguinis]|uniref:Ferric enterobactin receptor n=1 Tax=Saezia sanguinis TaxID=1965230 RepID=A0A433SFF1_9BURK|nr:TonB-dependent siderophore receptor [Saezia sanguinis]RUS67473.1 Ferric enterobactin receptor [Saezia sanguinis]